MIRRPAAPGVVRTLVVLTAATLAVAAPGVASDRTPLTSGAEAPEIRLSDQHGRPFSLSETLKQRAFVVLAFYPQAFTGG